MSKEFLTAGGTWIKKDGFGNYQVNGKPASGQQVQQIMKEHKEVVSTSSMDKSWKKFAGIMEGHRK